MGRFKSDERVASELIFKFSEEFDGTWVYNEATGHYITIVFEKIYDEWHVWLSKDGKIPGDPVVKIVPKEIKISQSAILAYLKSQEWAEIIHF